MTAPPFQPSYDSDEADAISAAAAKPDLLACEECGKLYANARGLAIHRGRSHAGRKAVPARNGRRIPVRTGTADALRELVEKLARLDELRTELAALEVDVAALQARLVKAWQA